MDLTLYEASFDGENESVVHAVQVPDALYERMARTDFSKIGVSEAASVNIDGEMSDVRLISLTPVIRQCVKLSIVDLLIRLIEERVKEGENIARKRYTDHLGDESALLLLLKRLMRRELYALCPALRL